MNAICLITLNPNHVWCKILNDFNNYKIFIIVDDNNFDLSEYEICYTNILFIKVDDTKCKNSGYINTNHTLKKLISGWDKALYYFGTNDLYDYIWFIEDDVYFYNENTLMNIDKKYIDDDLLSNKYSINHNGDKKVWHWPKINMTYSPPYYNGMMCIVRFSKKMLYHINDYACNNKTLFFLEALFPTVAIKNNLKYNNPIEFNKIHYRYTFDNNEINTYTLYHPVKNVNHHVHYRNFSQI